MCIYAYKDLCGILLVASYPLMILELSRRRTCVKVTNYASNPPRNVTTDWKEAIYNRTGAENNNLMLVRH